jgi:hypothetical protein
MGNGFGHPTRRDFLHEKAVVERVARKHYITTLHRLNYSNHHLIKLRLLIRNVEQSDDSR